MRWRKRDIRQSFNALKDSRWPRIVAIGWLVVVSLYFLWEAATYRGITAYFAEWEYSALREHYPMVTLALLIVIFGSPALWVLARVRRRKRRRLFRRGDDEVGYTVEAEKALLRVFLVCANVALLMTAVTLIWTVFLPSAEGPARPVVAATSVMPGEGHVTLVGTPVYRRIATYDQNTLVLHRIVQLAPMVGQGDAIRFFVEMTPDRLNDLRLHTDTQPYTGILKENALPGPIQRLFRYAGYRIAQPHYVLYASRASLCWPYYTIAFNCFVAACLLFLLGVFQRRRLRQAREQASDYAPIPADLDVKAAT